jgi:hypothetical protein
MNHEHIPCGAEVLVCHERAVAGDRRLYRVSFRSAAFAEIHHCPGCGAGLYPEFEAGQLRRLEWEDAA